MIPLTPELRDALRANDVARRAREDGRIDPPPVLKLFNPLSAAWLATEVGDDDDTLFGLADLGFGCPELGYFSLAEIGAIRLSFGMGIERDDAFGSAFPISIWAAWARRSGSILFAETLLRRAAQAGVDPHLPQRPGRPDGG